MLQLADEELMAQYQQGDLAAFDVLYQRYADRIYAYLLRLSGDRERAAELFQETFLHLHSQRCRYNPEKPFGAWIFRIARNLAYNQSRQAKRYDNLFKGSADIETLADGQGKDAAETLHTDFLHQQVETALSSLSEEQREVILLSYHGGLKYADIARVMGTTEDAIKQRMRRGMVLLRERLKAFLRSDAE